MQSGESLGRKEGLGDLVRKSGSDFEVSKDRNKSVLNQIMLLCSW